MVIAETLDQARDAAELIAVDYDELDAAADTAGALDDGVAQVWDEAPGNLSFDWERGDKDGTEAAFAKAARIVSVDLVNNRLSGCVPRAKLREERFPGSGHSIPRDATFSTPRARAGTACGAR